jgi:hypothetical protein
MQGCAQPRQGLPFDNPVQAKRSAGYENSKLNRMQYKEKIGLKSDRPKCPPDFQFVGSVCQAALFTVRC